MFYYHLLIATLSLLKKEWKGPNNPNTKLGDALQEAHPVRLDLDLVRLRAGNQASRMDLIKTRDNIKIEQLLIIEQKLYFQLTLWDSFLSLAEIKIDIKKGLAPTTTSSPHGYPKFLLPCIKLVLKSVNYLQQALRKSQKI